MPNPREICGNCVWFVPDPEADIPPTAPAFIQRQLRASSAPGAGPGGSTHTYGKCEAVYQDNNNETAIHNFGTYSDNTCTATDDEYLTLFYEK